VPPPLVLLQQRLLAGYAVPPPALLLLLPAGRTAPPLQPVWTAPSAPGASIHPERCKLFRQLTYHLSQQLLSTLHAAQLTNCQTPATARPPEQLLLWHSATCCRLKPATLPLTRIHSCHLGSSTPQNAGLWLQHTANKQQQAAGTQC
jgi:hypothetical protein